MARVRELDPHVHRKWSMSYWNSFVGVPACFTNPGSKWHEQVLFRISCTQVCAPGSAGASISRFLRARGGGFACAHAGAGKGANWKVETCKAHLEPEQKGPLSHMQTSSLRQAQPSSNNKSMSMDQDSQRLPKTLQKARTRVSQKGNQAGTNHFGDHYFEKPLNRPLRINSQRAKPLPSSGLRPWQPRAGCGAATLDPKQLRVLMAVRPPLGFHFNNAVQEKKNSQQASQRPTKVRKIMFTFPWATCRT